MERQRTLAKTSTAFEKYKKPTLKGLNALIEPFYPKAGKGRPPSELERMLRTHFLQSWFNISGQAVEKALYELCVTDREPQNQEITL